MCLMVAPSTACRLPGAWSCTRASSSSAGCAPGPSWRSRSTWASAKCRSKLRAAEGQWGLLPFRESAFSRCSRPRCPLPRGVLHLSFYNSKASHFRNGQVAVPDAVPTSGFTVAAVLKLMGICHQAMRTAFFHMSKTPWGNRALQDLTREGQRTPPTVPPTAGNHVFFCCGSPGFHSDPGGGGPFLPLASDPSP